METSQTIGKISEALSKAQGQIKPAAFDATNPHFKSKYATLASIMEAARPALSANGIAVIQGTSVEGDPIRVKVTTILAHVSGEWIKDSLSIKPMADTAQAVGSAISYSKRYLFSAMVGIVGDEDDDGEAAVGRNPEKPNVTPIRKIKEPFNPASPPEHQKVKDQSPDPVVLPKQINERVLKLREIFTLSGKLGQDPQTMKDAIGAILQLGRPIRESGELKDEQLEKVLQAFRKELSVLEKSAKVAA
jgi:hypothetical protein